MLLIHFCIYSGVILSKTLCNTSQSSVVLDGQCSQTLLSSFFHTRSMGFRMGDWAGQAIPKSISPATFFSKQFLNNQWECLGSISILHWWSEGGICQLFWGLYCMFLTWIQTPYPQNNQFTRLGSSHLRSTFCASWPTQFRSSEESISWGHS